MKIIFLFVFFVSACINNSKKSEDPYRLLYENWIFAIDFKSIDKQGKIVSPKGIELLLAEIKIKKHENHFEKYCLYYKTPIRNKSGEMAVVSGDGEYSCPIVSSGNIFTKITEIDELEFLHGPFNLNLVIKKNGKSVDWNFPFYNIVKGSIHEKYNSEKEIRKLNMLTILPFDFELNAKKIGKGKREDRYSLKTSIKCKSIKPSCEIAGEDFCELCNFGSFEVVDYSCPNGGSRYCGINHCGEKNEPACIRGRTIKDAEIDGICNEGLAPVLNSDHELVCQ